MCAFHFRWSFYAGGWSDIGFEWLDFGFAGALFGLTVLGPYLRMGHGLILRALALIGASALSYFCAFMTLNTEAWFPVAPVFTSFLLASVVGVTIVFVAARILIPLQVTAAFWFLGLAASLVGGAAMYAGFHVFGETALSTVVSFGAWHMLACVAIYYGQRPKDAQNGLLAAFARTRGRFSIVAGWMKLSHAMPG